VLEGGKEMKIYRWKGKKKYCLDFNEDDFDLLFETKTQPDFGACFSHDGKTYILSVMDRSKDYTIAEEITLDEGDNKDFTSQITCPYCGNEDQDSYEADDDSEDCDCGRCGGVFSYQRTVVITYDSQPVRAPEIVKLDILK
jgi:hypothetical protein